ncbi:MAG: DUF1704 domain-containing protein [Proteobacteria bacterium]|nr:DUF1704 domain-containing protein [Pseudomonadota bacterium]MDA0994829.1 DUF1704 domain-containing protein [Pseudomonadota bacterium]
MENRERIIAAADRLHQSTRKIRILTHIAWPQSHRERFLKNRSYKLPNIEYPPFDSTETNVQITEARKLIRDDSEIDGWLSRTADYIENSARLMAAVGTPAFLVHSRALYGAPTDTLRDGSSTDLVVFDADTVQDEATYIDPHRYPTGIDHVMVNGKFVIRSGALTGERPGMWIKGPARPERVTVNQDRD